MRGWSSSAGQSTGLVQACRAALLVTLAVYWLMRPSSSLISSAVLCSGLQRE